MKHTCYELKARNKSHQVEVGWDSIFETYYLVVFDESPRECRQLELDFLFQGSTHFYLGRWEKEIETVDELASRTEVFATIPPDVRVSLRDDAA